MVNIRKKQCWLHKPKEMVNKRKEDNETILSGCLLISLSQLTSKWDLTTEKGQVTGANVPLGSD